jgi:signal transduction histidine kinase
VYGLQRKGVAVKNELEAFVHKDGHHFGERTSSAVAIALNMILDIEYSISPIGNYTSGGAVVEFRDVTEQKKIERERVNAILMTEQQSSA